MWSTSSQLRAEGKPQKEIAQLIGSSQPTISSLEKQHGSPQWGIAHRGFRQTRAQSSAPPLNCVEPQQAHCTEGGLTAQRSELTTMWEGLTAQRSELTSC